MKIRAFFTSALIAVSSMLAADTDLRSTLAVTGTGVVRVRATRAEVSLAVEDQGRTALAVGRSLAGKQRPVLEVLGNMGAEDLESGTMNIYPRYDKKDSQKVVGYQGSLTVSFATTVENAGNMIDAALRAGANKLYGVNVVVDDETSTSARKQALKYATTDALDEAKVVFEALELRQGSIYKVEIIPDGHRGAVYSYAYKASAFESAAAAVPVEVTEGHEDISASLTLHIAYED